MAADMYADHYDWQRNNLGHAFTVSRTPCGEECDVINVCRNWMHNHEETQVMMASILVVIGLWWLVRVVLTLLLNLICPLLVVILAVICVPQLRDPLLGQNYQTLASLLKSILLKLAENIKTQSC